MEEWKTIDGYENYQVSNMGEVKNISTGKILKIKETENGDYTISLCNKGKHKTFRVHHLVAKAFLPIPTNKLANVVFHKDWNKSNNKSYNLKWITRDELLNIKSNILFRAGIYDILPGNITNELMNELKSKFKLD